MKKGDYVECIYNARWTRSSYHREPDLTIGQAYEILDVIPKSSNQAEEFHVRDDTGKLCWYYAWRFLDHPHTRSRRKEQRLIEIGIDDG